MSDFTTYLYFPESDDEITIRVSYDCDYSPARISGPPEDCYPASGEMSIYEIENLNPLPDGITPEMFAAAASQAEDRLEEEAWDHYHSRGIDG